MAEDQAATPLCKVNADQLLKWPSKDQRRFLYAAYCVDHLDHTIKFYTEALGMKLLSRKDVPEEKHSYAFLGFGPEETQFVVKLIHNYDVNSCDIRTGFGHLGLHTQDVHKLVENIRAKGGDIVKEPFLFTVDGSDYSGAVVKDHDDDDGCTFELVQVASTSTTAPSHPLNHVMLSVSDLDRSIEFYEKALGMRLIKKVIDNKSEHESAIAIIGYTNEKTAILELSLNCAGPQSNNKNSSAQVAIGTNDVYQSVKVVNLVTQELGGKITRPPGPLPGTKTKVASFLDPDGWEIVLIDNEDFLKEYLW